MRSRASVLGWAICLLSLLVVATTAGLAIVNHDAIHSLDQANVVEIAVPIGYAILGSLVVGQQPGNALRTRAGAAAAGAAARMKGRNATSTPARCNVSRYLFAVAWSTSRFSSRGLPSSIASIASGVLLNSCAIAAAAAAGVMPSANLPER